VTTVHCVCDSQDGETYNTIFVAVTPRNMAERQATHSDAAKAAPISKMLLALLHCAANQKSRFLIWTDVR